METAKGTLEETELQHISACLAVRPALTSVTWPIRGYMETPKKQGITNHMEQFSVLHN